MDFLKQRAEDTKKAFANHFKISYAVKANPNLTVLRRIKESAELLDISSGGELDRAIKAQWDPAKISFTGPGKTDAELRAAVDGRIGYVIVESVSEAERLSTIAGSSGTIQPVLVRISPARMPAGFGVSMSGRPTPFGIDEEDVEPALDRIFKLENVSVKGFHIYAGTQCLKDDAIAENYENYIRIFTELCAKYDLKPDKLVFGSGLGIPYHEGDRPLDIASVARRTNPSLNALRRTERFAATDLVLEIGRYLIGEAGYYLTRVVNIKNSRGATICLCDGGMHQHLAASGHLGSVIPRNYGMFRVRRNDEATEAELCTYELAGPLCTSIDRIGHKVKLPLIRVGDVISIECSGAYGLTSSPVHFISHELPKEILVEMVDGRLNAVDISERLH
jgi:diaminopimelate decarboxylase